MKVALHEAVVAPWATSVQLLLPNAPVEGEAETETLPVGAVPPLDDVSVTVTVQVVALPFVTEEGEQLTPVEVGSGGRIACHSSLPVPPSSAVKNRFPFTAVRSRGELPKPPVSPGLKVRGSMFLTSTVPAVLPSDCHSSLSRPRRRRP